MNFCKIVTYLLVAAYGVISVNAMFTKGSLIGTLEYTAEDARRSRPESPLSSQYNLVSHTNDIPHVEKQSEVEHHNEFLAKNSDITSLYRSNKRNFNIAFQNGEAEIKKLSDCVKQKQSSFSPPLLSDWGDDLLFSATEWDVYPTYPMESHSAGTQYNFAGAPVGLHHDHHNYYPQNFFYWENNFELMHQPAQSGALERIGLDGVAESQIEENGDFRESSITANMPLNSFFEKDLTAGLAGNSFSALSDEIRLAQQGEAKEEEKQGKTAISAIVVAKEQKEKKGRGTSKQPKLTKYWNVQEELHKTFGT
ncbi:hypothetical protein BY996DRAFT_6410753 [Phakopsora pachyrhizi]|nr:hypothetical protein BY996DRAFT_6410753 [Phakopsora pachyrhizi]